MIHIWPCINGNGTGGRGGGGRRLLNAQRGGAVDRRRIMGSDTHPEQVKAINTLFRVAHPPTASRQ